MSEAERRPQGRNSSAWPRLWEPSRLSEPDAAANSKHHFKMNIYIIVVITTPIPWKLERCVKCW